MRLGTVPSGQVPIDFNLRNATNRHGYRYGRSYTAAATADIDTDVYL